MSLTVAITAFNENERAYYQWIREATAVPLSHAGVDEVLVYDDGSDTGAHDLLDNLHLVGKVTFVAGRKNLGCFGAKIEAVAHSSSDWVLLLDSDNSIDRGVIDLLLREIKLAMYSEWMLPSFAKPAFDYRHISGRYSNANIGSIANEPRFDCFINTGNQCVHRQRFMEVFELHRAKQMSTSENACDSMRLNQLWLQAGGLLNCVAGFEYNHRIDTGKASNYNRAPADKEQIGKRIIEQMRLGK